MILIKTKDYYENDKERLKTQARDKYRNLSEEEKSKKKKYGTNRYYNMPEDKKQKLKEYQKSTVRLKNLNLINKVVFQLLFDSVCCELVIHH